MILMPLALSMDVSQKRNDRTSRQHSLLQGPKVNPKTIEGYQKYSRVRQHTVSQRVPKLRRTGPISCVYI